jgi:hypothetical protein
MKDSARYVKIVEWSEEDHCYVGGSPGLIYGGCHGDDEKLVFDDLWNARRGLEENDREKAAVPRAHQQRP